MSDTKINKLVRVTNKGLEIIDEELMNKVKKKKLSPSMVSSFQQCPADWLMDSFILKEIEHEEPIYFARGHIFHETMEKFYAEDKNKRNKKLLGKLATQVMKENYSHLIADKETMAWVMKALVGYVDIVPDYANEEIAMIEGKKGLTPGLEVFVNAHVGNTKRQVVGIVDKISVNEDGSLTIEDFKTGQKVGKFDPNEKISKDNDFGYWRQQIYYAMALEQKGLNISNVKLTYPIAGEVVHIDFKNEDLRKQVIEDFEELDRNFEICIEQNLFPFKGHFWCQWCGTLHPGYRARKKPQVNYYELSELVEFME